MQPLYDISVIVPTYNRKKLLKRAILSVINQSYQPFEIIVVDDGSTDNTQNLIQYEYSEVKYIYQVNKGVSQARNAGIKKAKGNWIAFLDSDDEWMPKKLELQVKKLNENPQHLICHTNEIWIRNNRPVNPKKKHKKYGGYIFEKCLPLCVISPSSVIIKKSVFERHGLFDTTLPACEDYDLWLRLCAFLPVLYLESQLIKKYGGHEDQLSQKYWGMDRFRILALEKIIINNAIKKEYRIAALDMCLQKLNIFIDGAKKRGKNDQYTKEFLDKIKQYEKYSFK